MAYSQGFSDHLLRQLNESNRRNLELQSLIAHKDDQLAGANAQLQRAFSTPRINAQPSLVQNLQKRNNDFQGQLRHAKQATADAQRKLNERTKEFNGVYLQQQQQIQALRQKLNLAGIDITTIAPLEDTSKVVSLEKDLAKANAELLRLRTAYSSLQRQFEAEKRQSEQHQSFPATAPGKVTQAQNDDEDMDDEEPNSPWIKQETGGPPTPETTPKQSPPSLNKSMPPPSTPRKQTQPSLYLQPIRKSSTSSNISIAPRVSTDKPAKKTTPAKPASISSASQTKSKKRRRSIEDEIESELEDLEIFDPTPRKRSRRSIGSNIDVDISDIREKFKFKAIMDYDSEGSCHYLLSSDPEDIVDNCEIWDHVKLVVDSWEEAKGECWAYEFEDKMRGRETKCCVSSKLRVEGRPTGRTSWRMGSEGKHACRKCVEENKPCFTWDGEGEGFKLLPLHEEDRDGRWPLKEGFEVRYWVNGE